MKKGGIEAIKFTISSFTSYILELLIFVGINALLIPTFGHAVLIVSTIISRTASSIYCYFFNAKLIFKTSHKTAMLKYYILIVVQMMTSAILVYLSARTIHIKVVYAKMIIDTLLFVISFFIQKYYIFVDKDLYDE